MTVRCDACKRVLTDEASIARRLGPTCAERRGARDAKSERKGARASAPRTRRARRTRSPRSKWAQLEMFESAAKAGYSTTPEGESSEAACPQP